MLGIIFLLLILFPPCFQFLVFGAALEVHYEFCSRDTFLKFDEGSVHSFGLPQCSPSLPLRGNQMSRTSISFLPQRDIYFIKRFIYLFYVCALSVCTYVNHIWSPRR